MPRPLYEESASGPQALHRPRGLVRLEDLKRGGSDSTSETAERRPADDDVMTDSHGERRASFRYSLTNGEGFIK